MFSRKLLTILIYILILLLIFIFQPSMMFDDAGMVRCFDYDSENANSSLLAFVLVMPFVALLSYFIVLIIELIFA